MGVWPLVSSQQADLARSTATGSVPNTQDFMTFAMTAVMVSGAGSCVLYRRPT